MRLCRFISLIVLATACSDLTGLRALSGTYTLRLVGGTPLPAPSGPGINPPLVIPDTIEIPIGPGSPSAFNLARSTVTQSAGEAPMTTRSTFAAQIKGDTLWVSSCPVGAFCTANALPPLFALVHGDTLRFPLTSSATAQVIRLEYVFVRGMS
jgi:hypothetical protein